MNGCLFRKVVPTLGLIENHQNVISPIMGYDSISSVFQLRTKDAKGA